jgi:molybdate transport system substrate-binding protein
MLLYSMGVFSPRRTTDGSVPRSDGRLLTVAAAADLTSAMGEVVDGFQRQHADIKVQVSFGSSGNFFAQLVNHAPFDVFLSADTDYPRRLIEQNLASEESKFTYAIGRIVLWAPSNSSLDMKNANARMLLDPSLRKIAIANPRYAPYGRAAEAALHKLGVYEQIKDKLVFGDNVAQTAQFIQSRAADIGIISRSQALALGGADRFWEIPQSAYPRIEQGGVILSWAKDPKAAEAFRAFIIGKEGQAILLRHGFSSPGD